MKLIRHFLLFQQVVDLLICVPFVDTFEMLLEIVFTRPDFPFGASGNAALVPFIAAVLIL